MTTAPLDGIRVLDLSRVLAGPFAAQTLGDLGAAVIKVERPGAGDDTRSWGPPFLTSAEGEEGDAAYFLSANRNKRSIAVDIATDEGQAIIRALAAESDVVLENFKSGGLAKYGLDYDSLKAVNPKLIYCSITGFGQTGPEAARAGYDFMIQGMSGLMSVTGESEEEGGQPTKAGVAVSDLFTGLYASTSICAALHRRNQTGEGAYIDLALFDCQLAAMANQAMNYLVSGRSPARVGAQHPNIVPYARVPSADGYFILAVGNNHQFEKFCAIAGHPEWAEDARFGRNRDRVDNRKALHALIEPVTRTRTSADWLAALDEAGVPCGPINSVAEAFGEPQAAARQMCRPVDHAQAGPVEITGSPIWMDGAPMDVRRAPPTLGQQTDEVLREALGKSADDIARLRDSGIIS